MSSDPPRVARGLLPWRSAVAGWVVAGVALAVGVPLFLCMPPWNDVTLHDMAVRSILRGGVHYRDVFDTNLPGIDWAMAGVRAAFGWSYEVLRAADLIVIAAEVWLLLGWVRLAGAPGYAVAWLAASAAMFYPFTSEFCHVQRDPWLLLPALVAARMRLARVLNPASARLSRSFLEGLVWGAAVWVKPHVVFPAGAMWVVSALLSARREPFRLIGRELLGLIAGGVVAGAAGVAWLVGTGAWPYFLDVFLNWNPNYMSGVVSAAGTRLMWQCEYFRPWGLLHLAAIPLAVLALREARAFSPRAGQTRRAWRDRWCYAAAGSESVAAARALLAAVYLAWLAQVVVLQKEFDYAQVPVMLLGMAVVATHRWAFGFAYLVWFALMGVLFNFTSLVPENEYPRPGVPALRLEQAPFTDPAILKLWPRCWREGGTPELRDKLGQYIDVHCGTNWENLEAVANYLRAVEPPLGPRELNCWHDSTHPLYLTFDLEPATRYMHYGTALGIRSEGDWVKKRIAEEVAASPQRYVVSDLLRMTKETDLAYKLQSGDEPHRLPRWFPVSQRGRFPWNQPVVFRSGRYLVHRVVNPVGDVTIPDWYTVDSLGPGLGRE